MVSALLWGADIDWAFADFCESDGVVFMTDNVAEIQKSEESHRAVVVSTKPITIGGVNIDFYERWTKTRPSQAQI